MDATKREDEEQPFIGRAFFRSRLQQAGGLSSCFCCSTDLEIKRLQSCLYFAQAPGAVAEDRDAVRAAVPGGAAGEGHGGGGAPLLAQCSQQVRLPRHDGDCHHTGESKIASGVVE